MEKKGRRTGRTPNGGEAAVPRETPAAPEPEATAAVTALPVPMTGGSAPRQLLDFPRHAFAALAESHAVLARGLDAFSREAAGLARSGIDAAAQSATEMLTVKTVVDAIEVNAGLAQRSFGAFVEGSTRLSELAVKLMADAAEPILAQFGESWFKPARLDP